MKGDDLFSGQRWERATPKWDGKLQCKWASELWGLCSTKHELGVVVLSLSLQRKKKVSCPFGIESTGHRKTLPSMGVLDSIQEVWEILASTAGVGQWLWFIYQTNNLQTKQKCDALSSSQCSIGLDPYLRDSEGSKQSLHDTELQWIMSYL